MKLSRVCHYALLAAGFLAAGYALGPHLGLKAPPQLAEAPAAELPHVADDEPEPSEPTEEQAELTPVPDELEEPAPAPLPVDPLNPNADLDRAWLIAEGPRRDPHNGRRIVTLTFDDGPGPRSTPALLRELDRYNVKASFFLIGEYLTGTTPRSEQVRAAARKLVEQGHGLGSHSFGHRLLTTLPKAEAQRQVDEAHERITAATGASPRYFRPPYGGLDAFGSSLVAAHGYTLVLWSVEAQDMVRNDEDGVFEDIRRQLEYAEGGIVLLHDIKMQTVRVTRRLLDYLSKRKYDPAHPERMGFEIVDLETYLRETNENPQPFATRTELAQARMARWRKRHPGPTSQPGS